MESLLERIAALESALNELHGQRQALKQKTRHWRGASLAVGALVLLTLPLRLGIADPPKNPKFPKDFNVLWLRVEADEMLIRDQGSRIAALQGTVSTHGNQIGQLQAAFNDHAGQIASLQKRIGTQEFKTAQFSRKDNELFITGANLHIESGLGATNGNPDNPASFLAADVRRNGLGNLIIGYNEERQDGVTSRTGSHNLIVGARHNYTGFGGIVTGDLSTINGPCASAIGGHGNTARGLFAAEIGGNNNEVNGEGSLICGGSGNRLNGGNSWIGGRSNTTLNRDDTGIPGIP